MGGALFLTALTLGISYLLRPGQQARRARLRTWQLAAARLELREVEIRDSLFDRPVLTARDAAGRRVRIDHHVGSAGENFTGLRVETTCGLTLQPMGWPKALNRSFDELDVYIGDKGFDAEVAVRGVPLLARALLDSDTRHMARRMVVGNLSLPGRRSVHTNRVVMMRGELRTRFDERSGLPTKHELCELLGSLIDLAARFERPRHPVARLAESIAREGDPVVRLRDVEMLVIDHADDPSTHVALRLCLGDAEPAVRLRAALALGDEGRATLLALAEAEIDDDIRAHAIAALGADFPAESTLLALQQALRARHVETADAAIRAFARGGSAEAGALLGKVLVRSSSRLAVAAARSLGTGGYAAGEGALLAALGRNEPELRLAVVEALGRVGTVRAVPPLEEAASQVGGLALRHATRQAVAAIHARLPGASPGQLSIAEAEAGQLSLADDDARGRLSLPE